MKLLIEGSAVCYAKKSPWLRNWNVGMIGDIVGNRGCSETEQSASDRTDWKLRPP